MSLAAADQVVRACAGTPDGRRAASRPGANLYEEDTLYVARGGGPTGRARAGAPDDRRAAFAAWSASR